MTEARKKFAELKERAAQISDTELDDFWATLAPAPIEFMIGEWAGGEASLWMEEFRGEVTASMVYDGRPVHDHFKVVDENAVIGIMNGKGALDGARHLYFYLERV
jgi:Domain of unknown function (DUF4334)